jgi:hypothetical protein
LQWKSPQSPRAKKAQQVWSSTKSMLIFFFNMKGIVHREFVPPNTTVNYDFYFGANCHWLLHHNTPAHTSLKSKEFVTNNNMVIVPHPAYSPYLAPCDFTLIPKLKMKLKGRRFETMSDIQRELQAVLDSIKEHYFHSAFEAWKKRWDRCIRSQGDYLLTHHS